MAATVDSSRKPAEVQLMFFFFFFFFFFCVGIFTYSNIISLYLSFTTNTTVSITVFSCFHHAVHCNKNCGCPGSRSFGKSFFNVLHTFQILTFFHFPLGLGRNLREKYNTIHCWLRCDCIGLGSMEFLDHYFYKNCGCCQWRFRKCITQYAFLIPSIAFVERGSQCYFDGC